MRQPLGRVAVASLLASAVGCWSAPTPYARDPLLKGSRVLYGDFDRARAGAVAPYPSLDPPPAPAEGKGWVAADGR